MLNVNGQGLGFGVAIVAVSGLVAYSATADESMSKDQKFVKHAYLTNLMEIREAEVVLEKGTSQDVKSYAQMMIRDHTQANEQLRPLAQQVGVELPSELLPWQQEKVSHMREMSGEELDMGYAFGQVGMHHIAILKHRHAAQQGENQQVSTMAQQMIPQLESHLRMVERIASQYASTSAGGTAGESGVTAPGTGGTGGGSGGGTGGAGGGNGGGGGAGGGM